MEKNIIGLSPEFIIPPGDTIRDLLIENNMSQGELAQRTSFSPKHVSEVLSGKKRISASFAKGLEYVFNISTEFWLNLQAIYDKELLEYKEKNEITKEEIEVAKQIEPILKYAYSLKLINKYNNDIEKVLIARNFCKINNLLNIEKILKLQVAYKTEIEQEVNSYVLYAWQRTCEMIADNNNLENNYNREKLIKNIENIKLLIFENDINIIIKKLENIFNKCGIIFEVVKYFQGAPVQGFIEKKNNNIILCITLKQLYADKFWYTLFHEIAHILNNDIENNKIDYYMDYSKKEERADTIAKNILIDSNEYKKFIEDNNITKESIKDFSKKNNIKEFILIWRLKEDNIINNNLYNELNLKYKFN